MRSRRLLFALGLALLLAAAPSLAQAGPSVSTQAVVEGEPLEQASPVAPGTSIHVVTNVTSPSGDQTEWRAFVNGTLDGDVNDTDTRTWSGGQTVGLDLVFQAPNETGGHAIGWNVTLQSRNTSDPGSGWTTEETRTEQVAFRVEEPSPPPSPQDVAVTVRTGSGTPISELGNLTPGEQVILDANVTLPARNDTHWNVSFLAFVNQTRVGQAQQVRTGGGSLPFVLSFNVPGQTGDHELTWRLQVQYRNASDSAWTPLTTREDTATISVQTLQPGPRPGLPWAWILGVGAIVLVGGGGAYYVLRKPRQIKGEPRSKAMQDLEGQTPEQTGEPEVHPQVKILEARAEDLRRMIELARERYDEGEITEHQFEQIKERKESELEDVEEEIEEYRQEGGGD